MEPKQYTQIFPRNDNFWNWTEMSGQLRVTYLSTGVNVSSEQKDLSDTWLELS